MAQQNRHKSESSVHILLMTIDSRVQTAHSTNQNLFLVEDPGNKALRILRSHNLIYILFLHCTHLFFMHIHVMASKHCKPPPINLDQNLAAEPRTQNLHFRA